MPLRVFLRVASEPLWLLGAAALLCTALTSCADCDTLDDCFESCDEAYPEDDERRSGCYLQCERGDYGCDATPPPEGDAAAQTRDAASR